MSGTLLRRRHPATRQKPRTPHPIRSSHGRTPPTYRRSKPSKPIKILTRCSSEPILWTVGFSESYQNHHHHYYNPNQEVLLFRPKTCTDVYSPLRSISPSPPSFRGYGEDSKVVVNVTVEGSPGPVRTMARLGAKVEEIIKLVVDRYSEEGRSPKLDRDAVSAFELHPSYFSLESLNKTARIGELGSRSFYLRRSCSSRSTSSYGEEEGGGRRGSGIDVSSKDQPVNSSFSAVFPLQLFPSFIARRISKIGRRTRKIWKILGCMACS